MFGNRFLGGVSFLPLFAPEGGAGSGGGDGGGPSGGAAGGAGASAGGAARPDGGAGGGAAGGGAAAGGGSAAGPGAGESAGTLAGGGSSSAAAAAAAVKPGELPAGFDFRAYLANGDESVAKDLAKYTDPRAIYSSLRDLQTKISKGELKAAPQPLPANATDDQKAEWRKANGLPATTDDYVKGLQLPDGLVIGEADKPLVESFAKALFEGGGSQAEMNRAVSWFYQAQDLVAGQREEADGQYRVDSEVALRTEWGPEYTKNMNAFGAFRSQLPEGLQTLLFTARTLDGQVLGNHPEFIKIGAQLGLELNPAATIVRQQGMDSAATVADRIKSIEGKMYTADGKENPEYWRGDSGAKMQQEYRDLLDMQAKLSARGKAA